MKIIKGMNRQVTNKKTMVNEHMKRCSTLLINKKVQIKTAKQHN